jgi:hypothetical protein
MSMSMDKGIRWYPQPGKWMAGYEENPEALKPIAIIYKKLTAALPHRARLRAVGESGMAARRLVEEFSSSLSPDALLRRLVMEGRCRICR